MKEFKIYQSLLLVTLSVFLISSCSTSSSLPYDDVYYSVKKSDDKKVVQDNILSDDIYKSSTETGDYQSYRKDETAVESTVPVGAGGQGNEIQSSDESASSEDIYYDTDYESRIKRFSNEGSNMDYYDDYYTGGNDCNCNGSNWNVSVGVGAGFGYGGYMGFSYGWPYYGYPYYGYPYYGYGYGGYWGGYNHGYYNGYWDGYYAGGGYGGYYPDYGYGGNYSNTYRPRGSHGGGSSVPRTGSRGSQGNTNPAYREKTVVAGGGSFGSRSNGGSAVSGGKVGSANQTPVRQKPAESVRLKSDVKPNRTDNTQSAKPKIDKPATRQEHTRPVNTQKYRTPQNTRSTVSQKPKYEKPKSYRSLPSQQPRSSKEYVAPKRNTAPNRQQSGTNVRTRKPVNQPKSNYNRSGNSSSNVKRTTPTRSNNSSRKPAMRTTTRSSSPSKSSPSKRYSSPKKSYSSPSRSYSSPSRSSGSSGGSRSTGGSSSSSSRSGGGRR
jgi:hypothetical protein